MIRNYIKIALRHLFKNKIYAGINIFGLTVGLAACLMIGLYIINELKYDTFHEKADRIVRLTMHYSMSGSTNEAAETGTKPGPFFKRTLPSVEEYVRTYMRDNVVKRGDKSFEEKQFLYADSAFFTVFSFSLLQGNAATALDEPNKIVITESMAKKYFGAENAFNQTLTIGKSDFLISGICKDVPQYSQIKFDFVTNFLNIEPNIVKEEWWTANWITYFLLKDASSLPKVQTQIDELMRLPNIRAEAHMEGNDYLAYHLEPLTSVHLHSKLTGFEPNGRVSQIYMFIVIALLILTIACANYTNLATAQSMGRSSEIGMRKVMGASRRQIFGQFLGESSAVTFISILLALILVTLSLQWFNAVTGRNFVVSDLLQPVFIVSTLGFAAFISILSGLYPALVLAGTQLTGILKKGFNFTGGNDLLRKSLIVVQFGVSVFLIVFTVIVFQQMKFIQTKDVGYDKDQVLILPFDRKMRENFDNIKDAFSQINGVESVTAAYEAPEFVRWEDGIIANDERGRQEIMLNAMPVDLDYIKTLKMGLLAGRDFIKSDFSLMDTSRNSEKFQQPFIINESLAKKIGWTPEQAIGKIIEKNHPGPIMGVVKDFNFESLHEPVKPLIMFLNRNLAHTLILRLKDNNLNSALAQLEIVWKQRVPHRPLDYHFLDEDYNKLYIAEQRAASLFKVASGLAILLACLGLFGLTAYSTVQRKKEIGIRRILGANIANITLLVAKNFLILISLAIIIAIPLSWFAGNMWLQDFAFRIAIPSWVLIATPVFTIAIALITISFHTIKAAVANPIKALRTE